MSGKLRRGYSWCILCLMILPNRRCGSGSACFVLMRFWGAEDLLSLQLQEAPDITGDFTVGARWLAGLSSPSSAVWGSWTYGELGTLAAVTCNICFAVASYLKAVVKMSVTWSRICCGDLICV